MMDVKNNNKFSSTGDHNSSMAHNSTNNNSTVGHHSPLIINSSIEQDSNKHLHLNSDDKLNHRLSMDRSSPGFSNEGNNRSAANNRHLNNHLSDNLNLLLRQTNESPTTPLDVPRSSANKNDLNEVDYRFSNLWPNRASNDDCSVLKNDSPRSDLIKNHSSSNLKDYYRSSLDHLAPINNYRNKSDINLRSLEQDNDLADSTDNILMTGSQFGSSHIDHRKNILENQDVINLLNSNILKHHPSNNHSNEKTSSVSQMMRDEEKKDQNKLNDEFSDNDRINDLINVPSRTNTLKRVSSDDKFSVDTSSIDSVVIDKQTNEIIRRNTNQSLPSKDDHTPLHPNSIIIQENLTVTLKRDKKDKKSLNEFSIKDMPSHIFESNSFVKEYFYDEPVIKSTSKFFEADLATYKMQSDPRGLCLIINNATTKKDCLRLKNGFTKEVNYLKDIFTRLGFFVEIYSNLKAKSILKLMKNLKNNPEFTEHDAFVCVYFGHGNQSYVISEDNFKLNLELMIGCMNNYHCAGLINKPKIFIIHTCNSTCETFYEPIAPSNLPREVNALKKISDFKVIPTWTDTIVIYSPFMNCKLEYSPFVKEFGISICNWAFEKSLHEILLRTNYQISSKPQYDGQITADLNYRGFNKSFFFNPGHYVRM